MTITPAFSASSAPTDGFRYQCRACSNTSGFRSAGAAPNGSPSLGDVARVVPLPLYRRESGSDARTLRGTDRNGTERNGTSMRTPLARCTQARTQSGRPRLFAACLPPAHSSKRPQAPKYSLPLPAVNLKGLLSKSLD